MKRIILPILTLLFTSCAVSNFYQVYKTNSENGVVNNDKIVFEDSNCKVYYNLSTEGGNVGFSIFNKTQNDLTINLSKTFFVLNGIAYEYFQNRTISKSTNTGSIVTSYNNPYYWNYNIARVSGTSSTTNTVTYVEKPILTIPPQTSINVSEYYVTNSLFSSCDLPKYPTKKQIKTLNYNKDNSPFVFYNLITYYHKSDTIRLENKFYVSEITNYPSKEMFSYTDTTTCGKKLEYRVPVFKKMSPDKFFIKYSTIKQY